MIVKGVKQKILCVFPHHKEVNRWPTETLLNQTHYAWVKFPFWGVSPRHEICSMVQYAQRMGGLQGQTFSPCESHYGVGLACEKPPSAAFLLYASVPLEPPHGLRPSAPTNFGKA